MIGYINICKLKLVGRLWSMKCDAISKHIFVSNTILSYYQNTHKQLCLHQNLIMPYLYPEYRKQFMLCIKILSREKISRECNLCKKHASDSDKHVILHCESVSGQLPPGQLPPGQLPPRTNATQDNCHPNNIIVKIVMAFRLIINEIQLLCLKMNAITYILETLRMLYYVDDVYSYIVHVITLYSTAPCVFIQYISTISC